MSRKLFSKNVKIEACGTRCGFCSYWINEKNKGFMFNTAEFYHWSCLLRLKDDVLELERRLNKERSSLSGHSDNEVEKNE